MAGKKSTYAGRQVHGARKAGFRVKKEADGWYVIGPALLIERWGPYHSKRAAIYKMREVFLDAKGLFPF